MAVIWSLQFVIVCLWPLIFDCLLGLSHCGNWILACITKHVCYHSLRSCISRGLTATDLVNGYPPFSTPLQNRCPLTDRQKICHRWLRPGLLHLSEIWWKSVHGGFWANRWNITQNFYLYLFNYSPNWSDCWPDFHTVDGWNNADSRKGVLLRFRWYCSSFKRSKIPMLGTWIGVFQPSAQNIETFILWGHDFRHKALEKNFCLCPHFSAVSPIWGDTVHTRVGKKLCKYRPICLCQWLQT